jgi:ferredoxin-NADP reductase
MPREPSSTSWPPWADVRAETAASEGRTGTAERAHHPSRRRSAGVPEPNATIVGREAVGSTIVRLVVRPDGGVPAFRAGQYFALGLDGSQGFVQRPYSTSSPPGDGDTLDFLVRLVADGSLTPRLWELRRGARLRLGPPKGLFTADAAAPRRLLLIGTGTGIAPLLSILGTHLRDAAAGRPATRPVVVHGASFAADLAGRSRLAAWESAGRISYVPAVSRAGDAANAGWRGATGRLDALLPGIIASCGIEPDATLAFVCGNPSLVAAARLVLCSSDIPIDAVRTEAWS